MKFWTWMLKGFLPAILLISIGSEFLQAKPEGYVLGILFCTLASGCFIGALEYYAHFVRKR